MLESFFKIKLRPGGKKLQKRCFPANIVTFSKATFFINHFRRTPHKTFPIQTTGDVPYQIVWYPFFLCNIRLRFSGAYENLSTKGELGFFSKTKKGSIYDAYDVGLFMKAER